MRIGVVSDTHNNLENCRDIVSLFNRSGVETVVHTGDITQAKTIEVFGHLEMPLVGVFGNNDLERETLDAAIAGCGFEFGEQVLKLRWADRSILVIHDPLDLQHYDLTEFDVVLHGHTHRLTVTREAHRLTFNPGECAGMMKGLNAIGILDLISLDTQIVNF